MSGKVRALRLALAAGTVDELLGSWAADVRVIARRERRRSCLPDRWDMVQEVEALAWEVVAEMVDEEARGVAPRSEYSFDAYVVQRLRNRVRSFADSEVGGAPAAGMKGVLRRGRRIRREMADSGRGVAEVVDWLNRGGVGHGGRYRVEDARVVRAPVALDALTVDEAAALTASDSDAAWLVPFEGVDFIEMVVTRVAAVNERAAVIVRAWLVATWVGEEPTLAAVAREVGVTRKRVRSAVGLGRVVGARVAVELGVEP